MNEEERGLQQRYMELQLLDQQIKQTQQQLGLLEQQIAELAGLEENLDEIEKVKTDSEIFAPLGQGVFIKASIKDNKEVLMNVGPNIHVKKKIPEAIEVIKAQKEELQNITKQIENSLQQAGLQEMLLQEELQKSTLGPKAKEQ